MDYWSNQKLTNYRTDNCAKWERFFTSISKYPVYVIPTLFLRPNCWQKHKTSYSKEAQNVDVLLSRKKPSPYTSLQAAFNKMVYLHIEDHHFSMHINDHKQRLLHDAMLTSNTTRIYPPLGNQHTHYMHTCTRSGIFLLCFVFFKEKSWENSHRNWLHGHGYTAVQFGCEQQGEIIIIMLMLEANF